MARDVGRIEQLSATATQHVLRRHYVQFDNLFGMYGVAGNEATVKDFHFHSLHFRLSQF